MSGEIVGRALDGVFGEQPEPRRNTVDHGNRARLKSGPIDKACNSTSLSRATQWKMPSMNS